MNVVPEEKDFLFQIDEFRKKAEALEGQMQLREERASELQSIVEKKQQKADDLDALIEERTKEADIVKRVIQDEIQTVSGQFTVQLNELQEALNQALVQNQTKQETSMQELSREVSDKLSNLENATKELPDQVHSESVQVYRNTQALVKELDNHVSEVKEVAEKTRKKSGIGVAILIICIINLLGGAMAYLFLSGNYKLIFDLFL